MLTTTAFEKISKREFMHWRLKKIVRTVCSIQAIPRPKLGLLYMDMHQFFYNEQLIPSKWHLKRSLCFEFYENPLSHFSLRESLLEPKIFIPNFGSLQCVCSKRLFSTKRHFKGKIYMLSKENHSSKFFETRISEI